MENKGGLFGRGASLTFVKGSRYRKYANMRIFNQNETRKETVNSKGEINYTVE